jgi:hypothetical protein
MLFILSLFLASSNGFRVPVSRNSYNIPSIEVRVVNGFVNSTVRLDLSMQRANRSPDTPETVLVNQLEFHLGDGVTFNATVRGNTDGFHGKLGVGPSSTLLSRFGSVGIFSNELFLNMTQLEFASRCVAESIVTIPIVDGGTSYDTPGSVSFGTLSRGWIDMSIQYPPLWLPSEVFYQLIDVLRNSGVEWNSLLPDRLSNCTLGAINLLPDLRINFEDRQTILVSPSDFIIHDQETNICAFHIRRVIGYGTAVVAPLALRGINVYIADGSSEMSLCDDASVVG